MFTLYIGSDGSGELIGRYCGNDTLPPYLASPSPNIWVQFVSDELINDAGFQLDYSFTSMYECKIHVEPIVSFY